MTLANANGRPISLIVPAEPLEVLDGKVVPLIELIPPVHQRVYQDGIGHLGVVVGDTFDAFVGAHKPVLTGQQFQGPNSTPDTVYILCDSRATIVPRKSEERPAAAMSV